MNEDALLAELDQSGQQHVACHLRSLAPGPRESMTRQLESFDWALVRTLAGLARAGAESAFVPAFEPAPVVRADRPAGELDAARRLGEEVIQSGSVAAFVVAGGQGSRLRFEGPKGCFAIGPVSGKSLFQIHAERVLAASRRWNAAIPLYVMTSETNDADVRAFFEGHGFFGFRPADVAFCVQRMLPAFDRRGRFLLDAPGHVFVNPDGHGGCFHALFASGALDDMDRRGIRIISYFQVDNPLVPAVDPLFIGEHVRTGSEMSSKVLRKRGPLERLGVFGRFDGSLRVIEYSEMSDDLQRRTLPDGSLKYAFGSIAVHALDAAFARRMAGADLPFHVAAKSIPCLDERGRLTEPDSPNGVKFERFVFDAIPLARNPLVLEVRREDEFAPVKNAAGDDSPDSARAALMAQHRRWLRAAGLDVPESWSVEIGPLFALDPDELRDKVSAVRPRDGLCLG